MSEFPRKGSVMYNVMKGDATKSNKTIKQFRFWNRFFVIPLYRFNILPLFFIGKIILLLQTIGRKSGKMRFTPLEYRVRNGKIYLASSRGKKSDWFRNIAANPEMVVYKRGFISHKAHPKIITSVEEKLDFLNWYSTTYSKAAKALFGWNSKIDTIETSDLTPIAEFIEIVQLN